MLNELLKKLIEKKYYTDKKLIENKLNVFYAMDRITDEEYSTLTLLVEETYKEASEEMETEKSVGEGE